MSNMISDPKKEVYFFHCKTCKYFSDSEFEEPCDTCLSTPYNDYSHKPVKYEEAENGISEKV